MSRDREATYFMYDVIIYGHSIVLGHVNIRFVLCDFLYVF